jgi:hypothetical protein
MWKFKEQFSVQLKKKLILQNLISRFSENRENILIEKYFGDWKDYPNYLLFVVQVRTGLSFLIYKRLDQLKRLKSKESLLTWMILKKKVSCN